MSSLPWEEYLQYYNEQKRLEKYQQERSLPKPKTTKIAVALHATLMLIFVFGFLGVLLAFSIWETWVNVLIWMLFLICLLESYGRLLATRIVECYQHYALEATRRKCKCVPSCSEYAILCLKKYELIYALLKIRKRLFVTCKGFDYIIDDP